MAGGEHIAEKNQRIWRTEFFIFFLLTAWLKKINSWYRDKLFIFDNTAIEDDEYTGLLSIVTDAICRYDIKLICLDNLMTANGLEMLNSDLYRQQSQFIKNVAKIAKRYDVAIILIAHPKKTKDNF